MSIEEFNVWVYLAQVAPVVLVMAIAVSSLWAKNNELIDKMHEKDKANLSTLQNISKILGDVKLDGSNHTAQIKDHIDDRIATLEKILHK